MHVVEIICEHDVYKWNDYLDISMYDKIELCISSINKWLLHSTEKSLYIHLMCVGGFWLSIDHSVESSIALFILRRNYIQYSKIKYWVKNCHV